ncbi:ABC transporter ATP-binding protein [Agrobacterium vitis]|uniref:ABC transporter ATP-binding protein n=1 Tax=Agrobacterium vitis TaxID=373 RepID=UPI0008727559|nr:ABC transporter ATP-binding protein [Agrobacterium vitis]MCE6073945.1 ATP-binding cassette domain-containing protein [Agrobacterium vitis]MCF1454370.1 ABC transporter ATP-binding protein [Agrobacterium vitis]MCM2468776.1 ABC transporter ATP-binding protein [Agrobacterium vitis]MUO71509.1 ATP-binding cassette domain-containing protein [Agrobacterium vitis]MUO86101.1 ATP-binding cassette domain-containing protein [Agrobacterium vitis]
MLIAAVIRLFERWVDPFTERADLCPPRGTSAFVWFYVRQAKGAFFAMALFGGAVAVMEASMFWFVGRLVDLIDTVPKAAGWQGLLGAHGLELLGIAAVVVFVRFAVITLSALVEEQVVVLNFLNLVRWQSHVHVARQSLSFFHNDFAGRIATKVWAGGQATGDLLTSLLQVAWFMVIYTISTMALLAQLDWVLAAIIAVWVLVFAVLARYFVPRIRRHARDTAEAGSALTGRLVDSYANIQTLKLFARERQNDHYIRAGFERFQAAQAPFTRLITGVRASLALLSGGMILMIAAVCIDRWFSGAMTAGGMAFTLGLVLRLSMLLNRMMTQLNGMMRNIGTIQNAAEMISQPIGLKDRPDAKVLDVTGPEIRFEDVSFHYGKQKGAIDHLSLTIKPGEKVGIVGRSGAGKTTLVNLLLRFYDVEGGGIRIDGQDLREVTQESLRGKIGMVTQDTALLHRSIRDNILFGRDEASEEQLRAAADQAEALGFIEKLVDQRGRTGFDVHVGERGVKLSGGQRQRIAIARVMLKDAPILVLDEATSALDSEVEAAIQSNLEQLMTGKTVLAIAHRLSTIASLDRLVVIDQGRIIEEGSHDELVERGGLYAELWARQSGGFIGGEEADRAAE